MLEKYEWYRRLTGGWYDFNKSDCSYRKRLFYDYTLNHNAVHYNCLSHTYAVYYPGKGKKSRLRLYAQLNKHA